MSLSTQQSVVTVSGRDLEAAASELTAALDPLSNARIVTLVSDINRWSSFAGRATLVAVVDHD